jgi:quercetin dioxygenase-like cupin family protein
MDRRAFTQLVPALLAAGMLTPEAFAQETEKLPHAEPTPGPGGVKPHGQLPELVSGVYTPGPGYGSLPQRKSHRFLVGRLKAGNLQIEMHETHQEVGAQHEPVETHLHNEIWLVREGACELMTNGVVRTMRTGDIGLCCAGDTHWVRNAGDTPCTYFVVTVGPPEAYS